MADLRSGDCAALIILGRALTSCCSALNRSASSSMKRRCSSLSICCVSELEWDVFIKINDCGLKLSFQFLLAFEMPSNHSGASLFNRQEINAPLAIRNAPRLFPRLHLAFDPLQIASALPSERTLI